MQIDESKVENTELYQEAFPISFAVFMLSWIIFYTLSMVWWSVIYNVFKTMDNNIW